MVDVVAVAAVAEMEVAAVDVAVAVAEVLAPVARSVSGKERHFSSVCTRKTYLWYHSLQILSRASHMKRGTPAR